MNIWGRLTTALALLAFLMAGVGHAQTVTWTGLSTEDDGNDLPANWLGNTLPLNNGTEEFIFGPAARSSVTFYDDVNARKISIIGITRPFQLDDDYGELTIGADGLVYAPATPLTSYLGAYPTVVPVNQAWSIQSGRLVVQYNIEGTGQITKTGAGTLAFEDTSSGSWTGGLTLSAGQMVVPAVYSLGPQISNALGTGALTFNGGTLVASLGYNTTNIDAQALILPNAIVSNGLISVKGQITTIFDGPSVTLNADTTIKAAGQPLYIATGVAESGGARKLIVDSSTPVILQGSSGWTGGTEVINRGILIFDGEDNTPGGTGSIKVAADAYVGSNVDNNVGLFLSEFDKTNTLGTIGFDTELNLAAGIVTTAIDLTGFNAGARLGSASHATLGAAATITPQGTSYRFGGGGGWLTVDSQLTGSRSLVLDSPASRPLTVRLTNGSTNYTGGTSVTHSGLIFGNTLPGIPGGVGSIMINTGGYVGFEQWGDQVETDLIANSLVKINPASTGMVGFEASISSPINLGSYTGGIYLGTAELVDHDGDYYGGNTLSGSITTGNGGTDPYRFAGYKGGRLIVDSTLSGAAGVRIGDPSSPATFGDPVREELSSVNLAGDNSGLTGNITLYGGRLEVDQGAGIVGTNPSTALGAGDLVVQGMSLPNEWKDADYSLPLPELAAGSTGMIIANDIVLNSSLNLGGYNAFNATGTISGAGGLTIASEDDGSDFNYRLGGNNTFSGGTYVRGNDSSNTYLWLDHDKATGTGTLGFGSTGDTYVKFTTATPEIGGLSTKDGDENVALYATLTNTVLTINQSTDSVFHGEFRSAATFPNDNFRIVKAGAGTLRLDDGGMYFYNGTAEAGIGNGEVSLQINQGAVVLGPDFYMGETSGTTIWVHGGTLVMDSADGYSLSTPLAVDNGGKVAGSGYLASSLAIGTGATLSPGSPFAGDNPIGRLDVWHVDAKAGGTLEWDIMKADVNSGAWDQIFISTPSTLDFTAINVNDPKSAATRFTLKVISRTLTGALGLLADFDSSQSYSWLVFETDGIALFDPEKVIIDTTLFANSLYDGAGYGYFFLTQNGNDLLLNFSPVPEPSTYVLMLAGLAAAGLSYRRRKNRA